MSGSRKDSTEAFIRAILEPANGEAHALADAQVSADGKRVVVTGSVFESLAGLPRAAVFAVEDDRLRRLTTADSSVRSPRFGPAGRDIAALMDRTMQGTYQLVIGDIWGGGELNSTPDVPGSVEYLQWSPDGTRVLLVVAAPGAELSSGQGSGTYATSNDDPAGWYPELESAIPVASWRSAWIYDTVAQRTDMVSPPLLNIWEASWLGDTEVLAVASDDPSEDAWYHARLVAFDAVGQQVHEVLHATAQFGLPAGSPDGRYAAVVDALCSDRGLVAGDVVVWDLRSGRPIRLDTAGADVTRIQWLGPSQLGFVGQRHLETVAGIVDLDSGITREVAVTSGSLGDQVQPDGSFSTDGAFVTVRSAYSTAPHVTLTSDGATATLFALDHPGIDLLRSRMGHLTTRSWVARDGIEIEGYLLTPDGPGPFPLVVNIHGGPVFAFRDQWAMGRSPVIATLVSSGYAVLCPNPRGSSGRGREFAELIVGDMGGEDGWDILSGIDRLVAEGIADASRVGLTGLSYGGYLTCWLATQHDLFRAIVPMSPITDWFSQTFTSNIGAWGMDFLGADPEDATSLAHTRSPVLHASKVTAPTLLIAGALDRCTPPDQAREFHRALRRHGVASELVIYPEEAHVVRAFPAVFDVSERVVGWFDDHLLSS